MNRYTSEPIEPFHVQAKTVRCTVTSGETSGGAAAPPPPARRSPSPLDELDTPLGKAAAAAVFGAAYFLVHYRPVFAGISVLVLLGAVMFRLDERRRKVAAAPLTLSAAMLMSQLGASTFNNWTFGVPPATLTGDTVTGWLPLFLAVCIFFSPKFPTVTLKVLMVLAFLVLGSGLIPGRGFEVIFYMVEYLLCIALAISITVDMVENGINLAPKPTLP
jgi:hypothetical protein